MKEKQIEYWKNQIKQMNPENQLELVEILIEELKFNEKYLKSENNYNDQLSKKLRNILEEVIKNNGNLELLNRFLNLSEESKIKIIKSNFCELIKTLEQEELIKLTLECEKKGHKYSDWEKHEYTERKETGKFKDYPAYYEITHVYWLRKCNCNDCGFVERSENEPLEIKQAREAEEKENIKKDLLRRLELLDKS